MPRKTKPLGLAETPATPATPATTPIVPPHHPVWNRPITPKQLARFLQVSPKTVSRLAKTNAIPSVKVGGRPRFIPADVIAALKKQS